MGIIKALKLMHDYYKYDENGHIEDTAYNYRNDVHALSIAGRS